MTTEARVAALSSVNDDTARKIGEQRLEIGVLRELLAKCAKYLREAADIYRDNDFPVLARLQLDLAAQCEAAAAKPGAAT